MGKPLQIRNVPDEVHDALRRKAHGAGLSLSAYALRILTEDAKRPTMEEVLARAAARGGERVSFRAAVEALDAERAERA